MRRRRCPFRVALVVVLGSFGAACADEEPDSDASTAPTVTTSPSEPSNPPPSSTNPPASTEAPGTSASTSTSTTTTVAPTMAQLPAGEQVAFSLPPVFAAVGADVPVVVSVDVEAVAVDVVDPSGAVLASLEPASQQFWIGAIAGSLVTGEELVVTPVAHTADGTSAEGPPVSIVVLPSNGMRLERREVGAIANVVYDRPWSGEPGELDSIEAEREGVPTHPPGIARVSDDEVAVLDTAASRVTCFDLTGASTCSVPLPEPAIGDMFPLGDGTLVIVDLGNREGSQELDVMRVEPSTGLVDVLYHEYPLEVAGYPGIATNTLFDWDAPSRTAWVSLPEGWSPPSDAAPDPTMFPSVDALHLDPGNVARGPTVQRPAPLRPDAISTAYRLLDGHAWVTLYEVEAPYFGTVGREVTDSGVIWLLLAIGAADTGQPSFELVRWRPSDLHFEACPIEYNGGETSTRPLAALDDDTVVVFDVSTGGRLRAFDFPPLPPHQIAGA